MPGEGSGTAAAATDRVWTGPPLALAATGVRAVLAGGWVAVAAASLLAVLGSVAWIVWFVLSSEFCAFVGCSPAALQSPGADPQLARAALDAAGMTDVVAVAGTFGGMMMLASVATMLAPVGWVAGSPWLVAGRHGGRAAPLALRGLALLGAVTAVAVAASLSPLAWFHAVMA